MLVVEHQTRSIVMRLQKGTIDVGNNDLDLVKYPSAVQQKLERLEDLKDSAFGKLHASSSKIEELKAAEVEAKRRLQELNDYDSRRQNVRVTRTPGKKGDLVEETVERVRDTKGLEDQEARVIAATERLSRARQRHQELSETYSANSKILNRCERYLTALPRGEEISLDETPPANPDEGEDYPDAIEYVREAISETQVKAKEVLRAPVTAADAKKAARQQISQLAEMGRPRVTQLLARGGKIEWPVLSLHGVKTDGYIPQVTDVTALVAWFTKDKLIERIEKEIDAQNDGDGLSADDRKFKLMELAETKLALEREEESLITQADEKGIEIARRPDADPRAVLGLSSALPPMRG
jgi:hypothetical protein